ncbi:hypothetical protein [Actinomycetospora soli]|uniref:hypothetical protein n=1 Tax=Actinomycetospora soli TaxID=2893887 RepID=UPI001E2E7627|nr:hypothetical protein [Actinomycetospora soli]MCD2188904.1 hypothetical protein [Actinomycetospora soli]
MTAPNSPAWYDTASTQAPAPRTPVGGADTDTVRTHAVYGAPADAAPAPAPAVGRTRRTVSARVTAAIGVVAFLLGVGVSMLTGPLLGGPGGPGDGAPGGPPGTSQQSGTTGTASGSGATGT